MNALVVGSDKSDILHHLPKSFLLIDDDVDWVPLPPRRKVTRLDLTVHSFNPLKDITYPKARELLHVLDAAFPEGDNTLTKRYSNFVLLQALLARPKNFAKLLIQSNTKEPGVLDAVQKIETILLSPVLKSFLAGPTNFSLAGILLAKLDRRVLSEFDCFLIASLLISNYAGPVVIPDFGFYGCAFHSTLIRQNRLIAGVNFLDESPLKKHLLLIEDKIARKCTAQDAQTLAEYAGLLPGTKGHSDFIGQAIDA